MMFEFDIIQMQKIQKVGKIEFSISRNYYDYDEYKNAYKKQCYNFWWFANCVYTKTANIENITSTTK